MAAPNAATVVSVDRNVPGSACAALLAGRIGIDKLALMLEDIASTAEEELRLPALAGSPGRHGSPPVVGRQPLPSLQGTFPFFRCISPEDPLPYDKALKGPAAPLRLSPSPAVKARPARPALPRHPLPGDLRDALPLPQPPQTAYVTVPTASYFCEMQGCPRAAGGRGFNHRNALKRHRRGVHERRARERDLRGSQFLVCPFCTDPEHSFPSRDDLQSHLLADHGDKVMDDPPLRDLLGENDED